LVRRLQLFSKDLERFGIGFELRLIVLQAQFVEHAENLPGLKPELLCQVRNRDRHRFCLYLSLHNKSFFKRATASSETDRFNALANLSFFSACSMHASCGQMYALRPLDLRLSNNSKLFPSFVAIRKKLSASP